MIEVAVALSGVVDHRPDFFLLMVVIVNAGVGFWDVRLEGNAIEALKDRLAVKARFPASRRAPSLRLPRLRSQYWRPAMLSLDRPAQRPSAWAVVSRENR